MNKIYIGKSGIHGKGVIAKRDIKRGKVCTVVKGRIKYVKIRNKNDSKKNPNCLGIAQNLWLCNINSPSLYLNHSCNPNVGIKGRVTIVALKDIKKDEELTFDYSITECDMFWEFDCSCSEENCRKKIRSIQFLPISIYNKYLPYIPRYFQKIYMRYHNLKVLPSIAVPRTLFMGKVENKRALLVPRQSHQSHHTPSHRVLLDNKHDR